MDILRAIGDPKVFGSHFRDKESWQAWFAFLAALFGLALTPEQAAIYQQCTGRSAPPTGSASEAWLVCGGVQARASSSPWSLCSSPPSSIGVLIWVQVSAAPSWSLPPTGGRREPSCAT